jgi:hypothetical protein
MIKLIIWSKDRACQLYLLLESIEQYTRYMFDTTVIYNGSDEQYLEGYYKVMKSIEGWNLDQDIYFVEEQNSIRYHTMNVIHFYENEHICFSTDDMVIYRQPPYRSYKDIYQFLPRYESEVFSFRLGLNTTMQDHYRGLYQPPLNKYIEHKVGPVISWNTMHHKCTDNYGYPLALDMHVFKKGMIDRIVGDEQWENSNQLESSLFNHRNLISYISSFKDSVAVNIPANNISGVTRSGKDFPYTHRELNDRFLAGQKIDLFAIGQEKIIGCHQEIEFKFIDI